VQIKLVAERSAGLCGIPINSEVKQYYETIFEIVIKNCLKDLNIDCLEEIIITDSFVKRVKQFQYEHGMCEEVTDNELGTAFGKTIIAKDTGKYHIFLDANIATYLLDDKLFEIYCHKDIEIKQDAILKRDQALNLLAHELSHVDYYSTVETRTLLPHNNGFDRFIEEQAFIMFSEYYACRRAYEFFSTSDRTTAKQTILQIESKASEVVDSYRRKQIHAKDFLLQFQQWLQMSLNITCYLLGEALFEHEVPDLSECRIQSIVDDIDYVFDALYSCAREEKRILMPISVRKYILEYYQQFGVDFDFDDDGVSIHLLDYE